jgi:hypothetical protein
MQQVSHIQGGKRVIIGALEASEYSATVEWGVPSKGHQKTETKGMVQPIQETTTSLKISNSHSLGSIPP